MLATLQEKLYLPLKSIWTMKVGLSLQEIERYSRHLLKNIDRLPALGCETAIILGSTRATAFAVNAALEDGHTDFIVVGGKKIGNEHPAFTDYVLRHMRDSDKKITQTSPDKTEAEFASELLRAKGISSENISHLPNDTTTHTGGSMRLLAAQGLGEQRALEFYTLAGYALRAFMTARKELSNAPVISVHNAYPEGVTSDNWSTEPVARAHLAGEAAKILGINPLYVRTGYAVPISLMREKERIQHYLEKTSHSNTPTAQPL